MSCINLTFLQNKAVCFSVLLNNVKRASEFTQILDGCSDGGGGGGKCNRRDFGAALI